MIDEPGSFYICTETSPRCYVIQKVRAKDLPKVCDDLGVLTLDDADRNTSPRTGTVTPGGYAAGNTPPLPILPWWFGPDCEQKLEAITCASASCNNELEDTGDGYGVSLAINNYDVQPVPTDGMIDYVVEHNGHETNLDYAGVPVVADQQLSIHVDHYSTPLAYPSLMSSPCNDHVSSGPINVPGAQSPESTEDGQVKWAPSSPGTIMELPFDELKTRVRHQLEYYFSRENLAADAYLRSQMDNDQFVKITTLANFNMVKRLTTDMNLIVQALRDSPVLQVNETGDKVRPIHKRCTLILREIPEGTKKEEVEELFSGPQCPKIVSSEYALNNIWYVNFDTDEDAQKAYLYLRKQVQCFKGRPILARIKTAPIPRVQQNGSRPTPPDTLSFQNVPCLSASSSPNVVTATSQVFISPSIDSSSYPNISMPFSTNIPIGLFSPDPIENINVSTESTMAISTSNQLYYYTMSQSQTVTPASAVVGSAPTAMLSTSPWPPSPNTFDLGYILQLNGFQAQGAYRPAMIVPAPMSPGCQLGPPIAGQHQPADRPPRRPRIGTNSYHRQSFDRAGAQSADSGRPPQSYNRYGPSSGARSANAASGYFNERRGSPYYREQNYHYSNIRGRPNRYGMMGNYSGNGSGMHGFSNYASYDSRTKYSSRGGRGNSHEYPGSYYPRNRKSNYGIAGANPSSGIMNNENREDSFDLLSTSFPPLPTATKENSEKLENEPASSDPKTRDQTIMETLQPTSASVSQPTQILQRDQNTEQTNVFPSPSPVVMVQPRMKPTALDDHNATSIVTSTSTATNKIRDGFQTEDLKSMNSSSMHRMASGVVMVRGSNTSIPVAVVQPNAQAKSQKVAMADKSTATDISPPTEPVIEECASQKIALCDTKTAEFQVPQTKSSVENEKKTSYADMAKHAAIRGGSVGPTTTFVAIQNSLTIQKNCASGDFVAKNNRSSGTSVIEAVQNANPPPKTEKDTRKWMTNVVVESDGECNDEDGFWQHRRTKNRYGSGIKKSHTKNFNLDIDGQQEFFERPSQLPSC